MKKFFVLVFFICCFKSHSQNEGLNNSSYLVQNNTTDRFMEDYESEVMPAVSPDKTGYQNIQYRENDLMKRDENFTKKNEPVVFSDFSVLVRENAVVLTWHASLPNSNIFIYRSTKNFSSFMSLADAVPIANITDTGMPFIDYPIAGIKYYYAIAEENQLANGNIKFVEGKNTVNEPIEILSRNDEVTNGKSNYATRYIPLPFLNPLKILPKKMQFFSSQTENAISTLTAEKRDYREFIVASNRKDPFIFADDRHTPDGGETMELQHILNSSFKNKNWVQCEKDLTNFLAIKRTGRVSARARFYLGEAQFFQNKYEKALLKFLTVKDMYPTQSTEWTNYCLLELANSH